MVESIKIMLNFLHQHHLRNYLYSDTNESQDIFIHSLLPTPHSLLPLNERNFVSL
jgi:hypothetical protein